MRHQVLSLVGTAMCKLHLHRGHPWRQHKAPVVSMHHHHGTNGACGEAPRVLISKAVLTFLMMEGG